MEQTISARYPHNSIQVEIFKFKCPTCKKCKLQGKGFGLLPERELREQPFEECAVDLIGPWPVKIHGKEHVFLALTMIDPVTNLTESIRVDSKESEHVARKFAQAWLSRYPWPDCCIHDNGGTFTGHQFQKLLVQSNITDVPTTSHNHTANAVYERMHQTAGNILRRLVH